MTFGGFVCVYIERERERAQADSLRFDRKRKKRDG